MWTSTMKSRAHLPRAKVRCWSSTPPKASKRKRAKICKGTIDDWVYDIAKSCRPLYNGIKEGDHIGKEYVESTGKLAQWQCAKAGYRLAHILNETMR